MELAELLNTSPETLAIAQRKALIEHVTQRLKNIGDYLACGDYEEVEARTFFSPAGDGMGSDNTCIDFSPMSTKEHWDIGVLIEKLKQLDSVIAASQNSPAKKQKK